jgi:hypothetical protein
VDNTSNRIANQCPARDETCAAPSLGEQLNRCGNGRFCGDGTVRAAADCHRIDQTRRGEIDRSDGNPRGSTWKRRTQ